MSAGNEWYVFADPEALPYIVTSTSVDIAPSGGETDPNVIRHWSGLLVVSDDSLPEDEWYIWSPPSPSSPVDPYRFEFDGMLWQARLNFGIPALRSVLGAASQPYSFSFDVHVERMEMPPYVERPGAWRGY